MGEYVRQSREDGTVAVVKTSDAMLDKIRELILERDALRLELMELRETEPTA